VQWNACEGRWVQWSECVRRWVSCNECEGRWEEGRWVQWNECVRRWVSCNECEGRWEAGAWRCAAWQGMGCNLQCKRAGAGAMHKRAVCKHSSRKHTCLQALWPRVNL